MPATSESAVQLFVLPTVLLGIVTQAGWYYGWMSFGFAQHHLMNVA